MNTMIKLYDATEENSQEHYPHWFQIPTIHTEY